MKRLHDNEPPPLRLAIVGCGRVVELCHLPALRSLPGIELVALVDPDAARLELISRLTGVRRCYGGYRQMLQDGAVDVVAACAPPQFHAEIGLAALDAGKHLFVEKPLALSLDDAARLAGAAAAAGVQSMTGFNLRWHRLVRQARSAIIGGALGEPATMHSTFTSRTAFPAQGSDWRMRPEVGGGVLFDLGIHHFDLWRFVLRCEVEEVFVRRHAAQPGAECLTVSAATANGVLVTGAFSHGISDSNEMDICGSRGRLSLSCYRFDSLRLDSNAPRGAIRTWMDAMVRALRNAPPAFAGWRRGGDMMASYRAQWRHFVEAIRGRARLQCDLSDASAALRVALAAAQSASTGRAVTVAQVPAPPEASSAASEPSRAAG